MLVLDQLTVDIQNSRILRGISMQVAAGQLVCLIGRNGAGKTTTFRTIMGYLTPVVGTVVLNDTSIVGLPTHKIAQLGIGYAPEESQVFGDLNVAENIELPTWTRPQGRDAKTRVERRAGSSAASQSSVSRCGHTAGKISWRRPLPTSGTRSGEYAVTRFTRWWRQ